MTMKTFMPMKNNLYVIILFLLVSCYGSRTTYSASLPTLYDDAPMSGFVHRLELGMHILSVSFDKAYICNDSINIEGTVVDSQNGEQIPYVNIALLEQISSENYQIIRFLGVTDNNGHFIISIPKKYQEGKLLFGFETPCHMSKIYAL